MTLENPILLKADLQEAAHILATMRPAHPILAQAVLQAIGLIEAIGAQSRADEAMMQHILPAGPATMSVTSSSDFAVRSITERRRTSLDFSRAPAPTPRTTP